MATQSPLHDRHVALGAKFSTFGGWEMPLEYPTGVLKEHAAVREAVGIFDVSHLGKLVLRGSGAAELVNTTLSNDLGRIEPAHAQYTLCCNDDGGVVDDLIVYLHAEDHLLLVPNAANAAEVRRRLEDAAPEGVAVTDHHRDQVVLAVQGPSSDEVLAAAGFPTGHEYMSFAAAPFEGEQVVVCRTGYTGERGYELIAPETVAGALWDRLTEVGAGHAMLPCGLAARDTLRTEMGYPLHGQDLSPQITPVMARLGWAVGWKKAAFWGRDALLAQREAGADVVLRGLLAQGRAIPRPGMSVRAGDEAIGSITSGTFSPTLRSGIALALIDSQVDEGAEVLVDVRGKAEVFVVTRPPFVQTQVKGA